MKPYYPALARLLESHASGDQHLLEIGCGEAHFITYTQQHGLRLSGYDIHEHAGSDGGRPKRLQANLAAAGIESGRVKYVGRGEPIPAESASVDAAISIQVLEHVADVGRLFAEINRVLKPGGTATHYFPTRRILIDPHSGVPFCHWFPALRRQLLFSGAVLGKFPQYRAERGYGLRQFVDEFDHYLSSLVHYRTVPELTAYSNRAGLSANFTCLKPARFGRPLYPIAQFFTSILMIQKKA